MPWRAAVNGTYFQIFLRQLNACVKIFLRMQRLIFSAWLLCFLCGCGWLGSRPAPVPQTQQFVNSGKVIDAVLLAKEGSLLIVPFPAGVNVAATDELEQASFMVVKGIYDTLKEKGAAFRLLESDSPQKPDFIIKGYMTRLSRSGGMIRGLIKGREMTVAAEGKLLERESGKPALIFSFQRKSAQKETDHRDLGYKVGQDIGEFIASHVH